MIPRQDIDAVKEKVAIEDVLLRYGVDLKPSGIQLKGLCPFHDERSPSFYVRPSTNTYHCFGCGEGGDVFQFLQKKEGFSFTDAVRMLAEQAGVELHETGRDEDTGPNKRRLYDALAAAAEFFRAKYKALDSEHIARKELRKRNLETVAGQPDWLDDFGIGYAPEGWTHLYEHLTAKGYTTEELKDAGLVGVSNTNGKVFDFFRGRLLWEIRDIQGRVVGFGARKLYDTDNGPKYLNTGETPLYRKSNVLYGLDMARKSAYDSKTIYVVEGYTDVMALAAIGVTNVVAACGTAFGDGHANIIRRLLGDNARYVFFFDADEAGQKAARKTFNLSAPIHSDAYVCVAEGGDPCDIRQNGGDEELRRQITIDNQVPLTQFILKSEQARFDITVPEGRAKFLSVAVDIVKTVSDVSLREDYIRKITFWSGSNIDTVRQLVRQAGNSSYAPPAPDEHMPPEYEEEATQRPARGSRKNQEALLALLLQYPQVLYPLLEHEGLDERLFDDDLAVVAMEVWIAVQSSQGDAPSGMTPDDFTSSDMVIKLWHYRFPLLERQTEQQRLDSVGRMARTFLRALKTFQTRSKTAEVQARVQAAFTEQRSEDESFLEEILQARQAAGAVRKKRNKKR